MSFGVVQDISVVWYTEMRGWIVIEVWWSRGVGSAVASCPLSLFLSCS